jgi:4-amino-4-deoxy-L-arabinose transferase-like glycosyltransferase
LTQARDAAVKTAQPPPSIVSEAPAAAARSELDSLCCPEKIASEKIAFTLLFVFSFAYLCMFRRYVNMDADEGILLQGAERILHGQVLYRDFFSFLTPGSFYLLAAFLRLFGDSIVVARTALAGEGAVLSVFTYLLARRACSQRVALAASALITLTFLPFA